MISIDCEQAIADALRCKSALFKFISANDVGQTGSHQYGFYLPKSAWRLFSPHPPVKGVNKDSFVEVCWQSGLVTNSRIVWYGSGTRSEYRLTRFGKDFRFLHHDNIGNLFIFIPISKAEFRAYVLESEDDIEEFQSALGIEIIGTWGVYGPGGNTLRTTDECILARFDSYAAALREFPLTKTIATEVQQILNDCIHKFQLMTPDEKLMHYITEEYSLFKMIERRLTEPAITRKFQDIDDFIETAASILNRRKSRAGKSLEYHVEEILSQAGIPFDSKPRIDGRVEPDILIPGKAAYEDPSFPTEKLVIVGIKTTCKDRWRQVLNEGKRIQRKHILTLQHGISSSQLGEMNEADVTLVVPKPLHGHYPNDRPFSILSLNDFIESVKQIGG